VAAVAIFITGIPASAYVRASRLHEIINNPIDSGIDEG
jgi:hypothetical protein